jgi:uncharacterized protein (TIGR00299 family) protein
MKILYYDCFAGISGDMNLGAMIDLGVDPDALINELKKLNVSGFELKISRQKRNAIEGTKVDVLLSAHSHTHSHDHTHGHDVKKGDHHGHAAHRNLTDIRDIIAASELSDIVKNNSIRIFERIAEAEAKVHGTTIDKIHFHEVGAVDSIVDVVGAAICFDFLGVDKIIASPVELGSGFVKCQHGLIPVPAPATLEILKNIPVKIGGVPHEATTPTGAAILAAMADEFSSNMNLSIDKIGIGVGTRDVEIPNILRVMLCHDNKVTAGCVEEKAIVFETNIDDMNPEFYEYVMDRLLESGARDVFLIPVIMKKSRPGNLLKVLCSVDDQDAVLKVLLKETTTLGVRRYPVDKICLEREFKKVVTKYGVFTIKVGILDGKAIKSKPEYEECRRAAAEHDVAIQEIYREIARTESS